MVIVRADVPLRKVRYNYCWSLNLTDVENLDEFKKNKKLSPVRHQGGNWTRLCRHNPVLYQLNQNSNDCKIKYETLFADYARINLVATSYAAEHS